MARHIGMTRSARSHSHSRTALGGAAALALLLLVAACSGGTNGNTSGAAANGVGLSPVRGAAEPRPASGGAPQPSGEHAGSAAGGSGQAAGASDADLTNLGRSLIKTATVALRSAHVGTVVVDIEHIAAARGGLIAREDTQTDRRGRPSSSDITLRVPEPAFDATVDQVAGLGSLVSEQRSTRDVTGRVADVNSRVASAQLAIRQLRQLMTHATKLGQVIELESQLAMREADLESLQAQQRALRAQTQLSTISVTVNRPLAPPPPVEPAAHRTGLVGGLEQGWAALVTLVFGVGRVLGAVLPIGALLALVAAVAWLAVRRVRPGWRGRRTRAQD
ncbi:MAG TPA: DUF4349 domain-containing protein [Nocardioidaceae bacterium]|nr:DUF4349 domain-containing protein [Nocardioidaceae bacterium]